MGGENDNEIVEEESWRRLISDIDKDKNGEIDFEEFREMMRAFCCNEN